MKLLLKSKSFILSLHTSPNTVGKEIYVTSSKFSAQLSLYDVAVAVAVALTVFIFCRSMCHAAHQEQAIVMGECSHEEADTRIVVHLIKYLENLIVVRTVDTDV